MEFMIRPRQGGKTYELMKRFLANPENTTVICHNQQRAHDLAYHAWTKMGREEPPNGISFYQSHFVSISSIDRLKGRSTQYMIDDLDMVLSYLLRNPTVFVTATGILSP